ncbi:TPA: hypothetical protein HA265_04315 [Candidatus Woesearchaeota archaeon]|nr:hypothetical protein [Candidatus Woesearchaeota archaeon]
MNDSLYDAREELKRADHLIFVSLKYTRTCDVLQHVIERLSNSIGFMFQALLEDLKEKGSIEEVPAAPIPRAKLVKEQFSGDELLEKFADLFMKMRKISKADFSRECEFRRHVTLTTMVDDSIVKVDIDIVTAWYKEIKELFEYVEKRVESPEE